MILVQPAFLLKSPGNFKYRTRSPKRIPKIRFLFPKTQICFDKFINTFLANYSFATEFVLAIISPF
jgi:hypothetical protein